MRHALPLLALAVTVVLTGCVGGVVPDAPATGTPTTEPAGPPYVELTDTPDAPSPTVTCPDADFLALYALSEPGFWAPDAVRYGAYVPPNGTTFYVAYVDGELAGVDVVTNEYADGLNLDGGEISLDRAYEGRHTVRVVAYRDVDGSGTFDADTDRACTNDGSLVQSGYYEVDFSRFAEEE